MPPRVVLVGMPGSGKSTVGQALADLLGVAFTDSDDLVVAREGRTVAELFAESEQAFRAAEARAVVTALTDYDGVLALGGGSLLSASVRSAVQGCDAPVVLLRADIATLAERVGTGSTRPLLAGDPVARLSGLAADRAGLYAEAADVAIDTDGHDVPTVARMVHDATVST